MQSENTPIQEIEQIYQNQKQYKYQLYKSSLKDRLDKIYKLLNLVRDSTQEIYDALYQDFQKPFTETDITEVIPVIGEANDVINNLKNWMNPVAVDTPFPLIGSQSKVEYQPKGQVLIISPWNYPFYLCMAPVIAAIAAGNTMIVKPSEYSPNTSRLIKKILESIFSKKEVAVVEGDYTVSEYLLGLRHDHIFFTGSTAVGRIIMQKAAVSLTPVTLELGGKSPTLIDETVDLKEACKKIAWGKFINCGQTCVAPDYILVPNNKVDLFISHLSSALHSMYGLKSENWQESSDYARIINRKHFNRLVGLLEDAKSHGAEIVIGGHIDEQQNYISPTVLASVDLNCDLMKEEIFGPLLPIIAYDSLDKAIDFINQREKPLALYVFSSRESNARKVLTETSSGGACINDVVIHLVNPNLPFGGIGESGMGNYHGIYGFRTFSHERAVLRQSSPVNTVQLLYPPYKSPMKSLAKDVIKNLV